MTRRQLWLASAMSASVCALIVIAVGAPAGWDAAALNALRARQVVPGTVPGSAASSQTSDAGALPSSSSSLAALPSGGSPSAAASSPPAGGGSASGSSPGAGGSGSGSSGSSGGKQSSPGGSGKSHSKTTKPTSPIKHVFVTTLATSDYADAFGRASVAPYLNGTLRPQGELLSGYQTLSGVPLADELALIGGQRPNSATTGNCPSYTDFPSGRAPNKHGLMPGTGCVYPNTVLTLGDQLDGADLPWRGYVDGMTSPCVHPNSGAADTIDSAGYDPRENPFLFFHSLLDLGDCQTYDLPFKQLASAVGASPKQVPSFVYISADPCDGGATGCPSAEPGSGTTSTETSPATTTSSSPGSTSGQPDPTVVAGNAFLKRVIPSILRSRAYRKSGALLILFSGTGGQAQAGSRTGALLLSPFIRKGSTNDHATNAYGVLRTLDKIFGLAPLGMARSAHPIALLERGK